MIQHTKKPVIILGAGSAGAMLVSSLNVDPKSEYFCAALFDDDPSKRHRRIHGVQIVGTLNEVESFAQKRNIDILILAMPSAKNEIRTKIIKYFSEKGFYLKTIPTIQELLEVNKPINIIRSIRIEDLLGREEINVRTEEINRYLNKKTIWVTGGAGSIGSELCRQIAKFKPAKIIVLDNNENGLFHLKNEFEHVYPDQVFVTHVCDVKDEYELNKYFLQEKPHLIYHAAAHKHVPLMEDHANEAIKNNVLGTWNVAKLAHQYNVQKFILISTDKAVNSTNVMGATKRASEMVLQQLSVMSQTEFVAVRFGNVLGSNGSVVPLFQKQIDMGGPVTVTHPDIKRYFMTIPEATLLVLQAGALAKGGELFILDMGEPVKICDLAQKMIDLSEKPNIKIKYTGLRPGEKLYEELALPSEVLMDTYHPKIKRLKIKPADIQLLQELINLQTDINKPTFDGKKWLSSIVKSYQKQENQDA